jgi:outer membrane receptor protein involved in Fe transport
MPRSVRAGHVLVLLLLGATARPQPATAPPSGASETTQADPARRGELSALETGASGSPEGEPDRAASDGDALPGETLVAQLTPDTPSADGTGTPYQTTVEAPAPTSAASAETIRDRDLRLRPYATPEDILRVVPGLVIAQHQGGGKADQLFLRGFDADHGTDVALSLDGIPVNLPSHAHGQGYADLHCLIPEVIDRVDVLKGPYFVEVGDFATAGAVNLRTRRSFSESSVQATYGSFQSWRVLGIGSTGASASTTWLAAEVSGTQGPFLVGEDLRRYTLFLKSTLQLVQHAVDAARQRLRVAVALERADPRPVRGPAESDPRHLDPFGSIDPTEGGQTQRQMLAVTGESHPSDTDELAFTAYVVRYRLTLFNDFTFQLRDEPNFDEIEQTDARVYAGLNAVYRRRIDFGDVRTVTTLGAQARLDSTTVGLWHVKQRVRLPTCAPAVEGAPLNPCTLDDVVQSDLAAFLQEDIRFTPWLRVLLGVRGDLFEWNVTNNGPNPSTAGNHGTGIVQRGIVNPKLQTIITPLTGWDLYLDAGGGFHSTDARAVVAQNGSGALPRAWGGEVGTRLSLLDRRLDLAAAFWAIHLQSEFVFVADEGTVEASDPTDRYGVDLEARFRILPWMLADFDLTLAHAVYTKDQGNGSAVALAPTLTGQAGLSVLHPAGWRGRIGARWVGSRPATENPTGLQAQGYFIVDLTFAYRWRFLEVGLVLENVLNTQWREAQFANHSYVAGRDDPGLAGTGVEDIHFTPGNPVNVRGTLALFF